MHVSTFCNFRFAVPNAACLRLRLDTLDIGKFGAEMFGCAKYYFCSRKYLLVSSSNAFFVCHFSDVIALQIRKKVYIHTSLVADVE